MEPIRILVVEDDQDINRLLCTILNDAGYFSQSAFSGSEAMLWAEKEGFDLVLLDLMLPGLTGEEFIAKVRQHGTMPIIVLSAKAGVEDRVKVLRLGADDFIPKPFDNQEVLARVEAQLRRVKKFSAPSEKKQRFVCGDLCLDPRSEKVTLKGRPVTLTSTEYQILKLLLSNRRQIFSPQRLYEAIWEEPYYYGAGNTITVHIRNLRQKIEPDPSNPVYIKTTWGRGYHCD